LVLPLLRSEVDRGESTTLTAGNERRLTTNELLSDQVP